MKHIVQFSGGKDSTCMLLMMLEKGMQVDEIIFCDTGMEFPQMYEHIDKVEQYIGRPITRIKPKYSYEYMMYEMKPKKEKNSEKGYGWASSIIRWCTGWMKEKPTREYLSNIGKYLLYVGIAFDEPKRHFGKYVPKNAIHPLYDWGITEKQALLTCYKHGFTWGGLYEKFDRVSCWCCPLQNLKSLRTLYHEYPNLWEELKSMDDRAWNQFRRDYSVQDLENKFKQEDYLKKISIPLFDVNTDDL